MRHLRHSGFDRASESDELQAFRRKRRVAVVFCECAATGNEIQSVISAPNTNNATNGTRLNEVHAVHKLKR